jgi:hypothetical protein
LLAALLLVSAPAAAQVPDSVPLPRYSTSQNAPCIDQPRSLAELADAFEKGRVPSVVELTRSWVAIGFVGDAPSLNCAGVTRAGRFEWVMVATEDSIEIDMIGAHPHRTPVVLDRGPELTLAVDFEADDLVEFRCRLTARGTLACLFGEQPWSRGVEFKKGPVEETRRAVHEARVP